MPGKCAVNSCDKIQGVNCYEDDGTTPLNFFGFKTVKGEVFEAWVRFCARRDSLTADDYKKKVICSRHFSPSDISGNRLSRCQLSKTAIPCRNPPPVPPKQSTVRVKRTVVGNNKNNNNNVEKDEATYSDTTASRDRSIHPMTAITSLLPSWHCEKTLSETWYFQVLYHSVNNDPGIRRSVKVPDDGSAPRFFVGGFAFRGWKKLCESAKGCRTEEEAFVRVLGEFSQVDLNTDPARSLLGPVAAGSRTGDRVFVRFINEQLRMRSEKPSARRWHPDVLKWAKAVHNHSRTAYNYIGSSGSLVLPTERTLSRYATSGLPKVECSDEVSSSVESAICQEINEN